MCSLKLFDMPKLLEFVDHVLPLLFHPVRKAAGMGGKVARNGRGGGKEWEGQ